MKQKRFHITLPKLKLFTLPRVKSKAGPPRAKKRLDFHSYMEVAGYHLTLKELNTLLIKISLMVSILALLGLAIKNFMGSDSLVSAFVAALVWIPAILPASYLLTWLGFYVSTDFRIARRREAVEKALPDYLQLAASNIRAGMTIDRALWLAIRPRFGILATEMEYVAKQTMSGEKLDVALNHLSNKYDSAILQRTISLINEGLRAGSEIGALLENISLDITDMYQRRDSMAANVTQYLIFILFAVSVAAPLLFGMSIQLLTVLNTVGSDLASQQTSSTSGTISISLSGEAVKEGDFFLFCILSILSTAFFSSLIVSNIKHGSGKDVVKMAPIIAIVALTLFLLSSWVLSYLFEGLI